jgi:hypothetical protein
LEDQAAPTDALHEAHDSLAEHLPAEPVHDEHPFLRAILNDDGEIRYRLRTRQRLGAKYLLREVFD